jgi:hypothetical protein
MFGRFVFGAGLKEDERRNLMYLEGKAMVSREVLNSIDDLFRTPLFKMGFLEFFRRTQEEGIVAARSFWNVHHATTFLVPNAPEIFERMIDFYIILGFVPRSRYERVVRENEKLKEENNALSGVLGELQNALRISNENIREKTLRAAGERQTAQDDQKEKSVLEMAHA